MSMYGTFCKVASLIFAPIFSGPRLLSGFDQVSVVMRQSIINLGTPNELRGRVGSVNSIFVGASNQLGAAESGLVAAWANSAVFAVASGGGACLAAVGIMVALIPSLWRYREPLHANNAER